MDAWLSWGLTWFFWGAVAALGLLILLCATIFVIQWVHRDEMFEDLGLRPKKRRDE